MLRTDSLSRFRTAFARFFFSAPLLVTAVLVSGCSDGDGGAAEAGLNTGTVALVLSDGPTDEYDQIIVKITEISLLPARGNGEPGVVIFRDDDGLEVDLLDLREEDMLLAVDRSVPAGRYRKIRLQIAEIRGVGGTCERFKLPSGKIDFNPRGGFVVGDDEGILVRLDVDAEKSIHLARTGSGSCLFRPVVFVEVIPEGLSRRCPGLVSGTIVRVLDDDDDELGDDDNGPDDDGLDEIAEEIEGFLLRIGTGQRGDVVVRLRDDTVILDSSGLRVERDALVAGADVRVRGRINGDGRVVATVVIVGDVDTVRGLVEEPVEDGRFLLSLSPEDALGVELADEALVLVGCDTVAGGDAIQPGVSAIVVGELVPGSLRAIAVFLRGADIRGRLFDLQPVVGGRLLRVRQETASGSIVERSVFLPAEVGIFLDGDGEVDPDLLAELLCRERDVEIDIEGETTDTVRAVTVDDDELEGTVDALEAVGDERFLSIEGERVRVAEGATFLDEEGNLSSSDEVLPGDEVTVFGLDGCEGDEVRFHAFVIRKLPATSI